MQTALVRSCSRAGALATSAHGKPRTAAATTPRPHVRRQSSLQVRVYQSDSSATSSSSSSSSGPGSTALLVPTIFGSLEALLERQFSGGGSGGRNDWQEVEGNWVLRPPAGVRPEAVVHFLGGAFVGAAPQLSYRSFIEALASRGVIVITTPFATSFDQLRVADEVQYKFDRCCKALQVEIGGLPVHGCGHSMGALLHMIINARYAVQRDGNILMSYNNRPATDAIPFLSPVLAPSARAVGPLMEQLATSPLRMGLETVTEALRGLSPSLMRQLMPLVDQLTPIYMDVAQGRQEFSPSPQEMAQMLRNYYAVSRNLILKFRNDTIDDSIELAQLLESSSAISSNLDLSLKTLDGDHIRPMSQSFVDLPPEVARVANQAAAQGGQLLGRLASVANQMGVSGAASPLDDLSKGVSNMASMLSGQGGAGGPVADSIQSLADEVAAWMGVGDVVVKGKRTLPASAFSRVQPQQQQPATS